jgi:hypothetical protein
MSKVVSFSTKVPAMTDQAICALQHMQESLTHLPQEAISTHHVLHGGIYTRTVKVAKGVFIIGVIIKVPTTLIVNGDCTVNLGDQLVRLTGHCVIPASAGRKQAFMAHEDTYLTMSFATSATSIEQAEDEFTDDGKTLLSRHQDAINEIIITGE